jgi:hypothetical protein
MFLRRYARACAGGLLHFRWALRRGLVYRPLEMRARRTALAVAMVIGLVLGPGSARALPPVQLRYSEGSTCGSATALATRLTARGVKLSAAGTELDVVAMTRAEGAEATFVLVGREGEARRTLAAETCDAVLDAVAFAVELALSGGALDVAPPPVVEPAPPAPAPPAPVPPPSAFQPPLPRLPAPSGPVEWSFGGRGGIASGTSPRVSPVLAIHGRVELPLGRLLVPTLEVGAVLALPTTTTRANVEVAFASQVAFMNVCPLRLRNQAATLQLTPCARVEVGRIEAKTDAVAGAKLTQNPSVAAGLAMSGRAFVAAPLFVELEMSAMAPLVRSEFSVANTSAYDVPLVRLGFAFGAGLRFP